MFQLFDDIFGSVLTMVGAILAMISLVLGLITLFFGHKIFRVFAALIGLTFGLVLVPQLSVGQLEIVKIMLIIAIMVFCGVLAVYAQKAMIILAGFLGLGLMGYFFTSLLNLPQYIGWMLFIGFGILGAWLISKYLDWAVVVISSILGAIMAGAGLGGLTKFKFLIDLLIFFGLLAAGIYFQSREINIAEK